jgi:hypothetical protein
MKRFIAAAALTMFAIGAAHAGSSISLHHADTIAPQSAEGCTLDRGSGAPVDSCVTTSLSHSNSTHR